MFEKLSSMFTSIRISMLLMSPLALVVTINFSSIAYGATYYVATNGNDTGNGSSGSPWRTIQKGVNTVNAGDTLIVKAGTYNERVHLPKSGSATQPITIKGERGASGEYLTIVDGGETVGSWTLATAEFGSGTQVYKRALPSWSYEGWSSLPACSMTANGRSILYISPYISESNTRINGPNGWTPTPDQLITYSASQVVSHYVSNVAFWDGVEGLFMVRGPNIYVRFRNGDNPNTKTIKVSPGYVGCNLNNSPLTATFFLLNKSFLTISDLEIRGATFGVAIRGTSDSNIIENNYIHDGDIQVNVYGIGLTTGPNGNIIRNNQITPNNFGFGTTLTYNMGAWEGDVGPSAPYLYRVRGHIYIMNKFVSGNPNLSDSTNSIGLIRSRNTKIYNNTIYDTLIGMSYTYDDNGGTEFFSNTLRNGGTITFWEPMGANVQVHDNQISDANMCFRFQNWSQTQYTPYASYYVYRNTCWMPPGRGFAGMYVHSNGGEANDAPSSIAFYNNTIVGSPTGIIVGYETSGYGLPKVLIINNIVQSSSRAMGAFWSGSDFCNVRSRLAGWDYNWEYGTVDNCAWRFSNNTKSGSKIWNDSSFSSFSSAVSSTQNVGIVGIDVSKDFTIGDTIYSPLPGFSSTTSTTITTTITTTTGAGNTVAPTRPSSPINLNVSQQK